MTLPDVDAALYTLLNSAAAITSAGSTGIRNMQAKSTDALPYVLFYMGDGRIPNTEPRDTLDIIYRVESRTDSESGGASRAYSIHAAVYNAVHEQSLSISGWSNYWLVCTREQRFVESIEAKQYYRFIWDVQLRASKD